MLSHNSSHIQFTTYTQFHDPNITIYHVNLVSLIQLHWFFPQLSSGLDAKKQSHHRGLHYTCIWENEYITKVPQMHHKPKFSQ